MQPTLHYTVTRNEIRPYMEAVPVVVSAAGYTFKGKRGYYLRPPPLPDHVVMRGGDCGGLVAATRWGGQYRFRERDYVAWLKKWRPQWAATMDLPCVNLGTQGKLVYPGAEEVKRRQKFTTKMAYHFWEVYQHIPLAWVVTIQGYHPHEYVWHAQKLAPLIKEMRETYEDAASVEDDEMGNAYRVGIGSLCGRDPLLVQEIVSSVRAVLGYVPLHLWGTKLKLLQSPIEMDGIVSLDTASWNDLFYETHEKRRQSDLSEAEYCWKESYPVYAEKVAEAAQHVRFSPIIETSTVPFTTLQQAHAAAQIRLPDHLCYRLSGKGSGE